MGHSNRKRWGTAVNRVILLFAGAIVLSGGIASDSSAAALGAVTGFTWNATNNWYTFGAGGSIQVRVVFYKSDIFRIWTSSTTGTFTDAENTGTGSDTMKIVVYKGTPIQPTLDSTSLSGYYLLKTSECVLRILRSACRFGLYDATNTTQIFQETAPIFVSTTTYQTLSRTTIDHYYGAGALNGQFCLDGIADVKARYIQNYDSLGSPNPAPWYCSTAGYGAFRNTWNNTGTYNFSGASTITTSHGENRFDCFYCYGPSLKKVLRGYTDITGAPFMPPIWGCELGVAGWYTGETRSYFPAETPAELCQAFWASYDIPFGWWFPNDSYNAQLANVQARVPALKAVNNWCGAWCGSAFNDITNRTTCVRDWGVRGFKLDCSWIGGGGKTCFDALMQVNTYGLEALSNDDARSFSWTTAGWAGTQRVSIAWTGDQYGSLSPWMRWHIPTTQCAAMSAMNGTSVDLAAIFDDSRYADANSSAASCFVRCWQWQMWMPYLYIMDGWSTPLNRMPWHRAPSYIDSVLRPSMKLRTRLIPYIYTLCADANQTGVTGQRPPLLEFPSDTTTYTNTYCKQEYMLGPWFLIRPVYEHSTLSQGNSNITMWLPGTSSTRWIEYYKGTVADGGQNVTCDVGIAPVSPTTGFTAGYSPKIPVWVREGAVIPMWPEQYYSGNILIRPNNPGNTLKNTTTQVYGPTTIDIFPHRTATTSFSMYEDDGLTKQYKTGLWGRTLFTSNAISVASNNRMMLTAGAMTGGAFTGKQAKKIYIATFHTGIIKGNTTKPLVVWVGATNPAERTSKALLLSTAGTGWFWDLTKGVAWVKTDTVLTSVASVLAVDFIAGLSAPTGETGVFSDVTSKNVLNNMYAFSRAGMLTITFANRVNCQMQASIFNLQGKVVSSRTLNVINGVAERWNLSNAVCGNYVLRIAYDGKTVSRKFVLQK